MNVPDVFIFMNCRHLLEIFQVIISVIQIGINGEVANPEGSEVLEEMGKPIEIEFAVDLNRPVNDPKIFYCLQIRPIVDNKESVTTDLEKVSKEKTIIYSKSALGNGAITDLCDIVYIRPESFNPAKNSELVERISRINEEFRIAQKNYILIGPGRWGSQDPWLGIPVKWPQISAARVIVESGLEI